MAKGQHFMKKHKPSIGIIGCGWLGLALAKACAAKSFDTIVTTQRKSSLATAKQQGFNGHLLSFPLTLDNIERYPVFQQDMLIVCFPPKIRRGQKDYATNMAQLVEQSKNNNVRKIILISTTAVYQGYTGEVDETTPLKLDIEKVAILAEAEHHVCSFSDDSVVLRCAGLVGPERHPTNFFAKGREIKSPNAYVNLVHQFDVVEQVIAFITHQLAGGIYNCVSDMQVTKQHFYEVAAKASGKPAPKFDKLSELDLGKQVMANKLRQTSPVPFQFNDLISWASAPNNLS